MNKKKIISGFLVVLAIALSVVLFNSINSVSAQNKVFGTKDVVSPDKKASCGCGMASCQNKTNEDGSCGCGKSSSCGKSFVDKNNDGVCDNLKK
jgi:hypothetical protein